MHHGYTPLFIAARTGQLELLRGLLEANAEKDKANHSATPLFITPQSGQSEVARRLLEANADKDKAMHDGSTPLFMAAQDGQSEVACLLLEADSDKDRAMHDGDPQCRQGPNQVGWRHTLVYLFPSQRRMDTGSSHGFCRSRTHARTNAEGIGDAARHLECLHAFGQSAER
ncbi:ANKRD29 [Symbiodinium necroappetens]|uniref:ANKRD29 protein n=1 Tax=Symbiodinium necroappetens TaxID=1628268 RepID=A0A812PLV9_9DINO|nr:ANKRD29 [Symbiodinium necroappetens]